MKQNKSAGFSLVETSISLTIIALLAAAVTAGTNVKRQLELNQIIEDISSISTAVELFQENYGGAYPGDKFDAEGIFGSSYTDNGNGDNKLGTNDGTGTSDNETLLFWQHLSLADLISGTYDGATDGVGGRMEGPMDKSLYGAVKDNDSSLLYITFGKYNNSFDDLGVLTTKEAYDMDKKYDDGDPIRGALQASDSSDHGTYDCVTAGSAYNLANQNTKPCIMNFYIEQD